ncbi:MAG: GtrA family protein [Anaerolineae bacterium]|nr:GtrA family protein [Anaerolineae bacterium]NUQ06178.1 GtrA family protein [Anaerolineae bacterium]
MKSAENVFPASDARAIPVLRPLKAALAGAFLRYVIAGGVNSVFTYVIYLLLLPITPYTAAYGVSYFAGVPVGYVLNALFVFRQPLRWRSALRFPAVYIVQYLLGTLFTVLLVDGIGLDASYAAALGTLMTVPVAFVITRFLLKSGRAVESAAEQPV